MTTMEASDDQGQAVECHRPWRAGTAPGGMRGTWNDDGRCWRRGGGRGRRRARGRRRRWCCGRRGWRYRDRRGAGAHSPGGRGRTPTLATYQGDRGGTRLPADMAVYPVPPSQGSAGRTTTPAPTATITRCGQIRVRSSALSSERQARQIWLKRVVRAGRPKRPARITQIACSLMPFRRRMWGKSLSQRRFYQFQCYSRRVDGAEAL